MFFLVVVFIMLTPFSYAEAFGIRVLVLQVFVGLVAFFYNLIKNKKSSFHFDLSLFLLALLWVLVFAYSAYTAAYQELYALSVFMLLFFLTIQFDSGFVDRLVKFYLFSVLFTAGAVVLQVVLHLFFGFQLFRFELFGGGRHAYSFLWKDYSFISLFLVSAIPLLWNKSIGLKFLLPVVFLLIASIMTSARTGVVAFVLFMFLYVGYAFITSIPSGKFKKYILAIGFFMTITPLLLIIGMEILTGRQVTASSSGRFDDFTLGYYFLMDNIWFGALFDKGFYGQAVSAVPHNVFLYILIMGGLVSFIVFIAWFIVVCIKLLKADKRVLAALTICLIGFQFIPSFFSAYFLAILLGIAFISVRSNRQNLTKAEKFK